MVCLGISHSFRQVDRIAAVAKVDTLESITKDTSRIKLLIPTFLGNSQRNYYGNSAPSKLDILWKFKLGEGITVISRKLGERKWAGAGWTGQPLLLMEDSVLYIIQGSFDHYLRKIRADSAKVIWQYAFDDVVKGTATIWDNKHAREWKNRMVMYCFGEKK